MGTTSPESAVSAVAKMLGSGSLPQELQVLSFALGMDPNPKEELQRPDVNYLQEVAKLPVDLADIPSGTDVQSMRRWIDEVFVNGGLAEQRLKFDIRRRRPKQKIDKTILSIQSSDGSNGSYGLWIYEPHVETECRPNSRPAILMFHGGGWIHGTPIGDEPFAEIFASELDAVIFGVDYRLAPENQSPVPLNDCTAALEWVIMNAGKYGIDTNLIALWGASAGANLAAALALKYAKTQPRVDQSGICLVSLAVPVVAHPKAQALFEEHRSFPKSHNEAVFANVPGPPEQAVLELEKLFALYIGDTADPFDPLISPLVAQPSSNHPPTRITTAACDHLRAQGQAYAELLRFHGVRVTEDVLPGVPHGFTLALNATVAKEWVEREVDSFAAEFGR
ncbi:hypothetical protein B7494_g3009 [Chlorociboria aeruginascens]|nr:hypothetical protein B7494_g3009 [Chlorociboria aeruginascens]